MTHKYTKNFLCTLVPATSFVVECRLYKDTGTIDIVISYEQLIKLKLYKKNK